MGTILTDIALRLYAQTTELKKGLAEANKNIKNFQKQTDSFNKKAVNAFKGLGAAVAGAFALRRIQQFATEAAKLASQVNGVRAAFKKLANSEQVLEDLKKATRGTVSEMELMQQAIKADNFKIPMDALAAGLEFATKRAAQTGESVDYLVNSFVTGLGRKSVLILDNLGISASALKDEVAKTGDFMKAVVNITNTELVKMGDVLLTDAQVMAQFATKITEAKTRFGELVLKGIIPFVKAGSNILDSINSQEKALRSQREGITLLIKSATDAAASEDVRRVAIEKLNTEYSQYIGNIDTEKITNEELLTILDKVNRSYDEKLKAVVLQKQLDALTKEENKTLNKSLKLLEQKQFAQQQIANFEGRIANGIKLTAQENSQYEIAVFNLENINKKLGEQAEKGETLAVQIKDRTTALEKQNEIVKGTAVVTEEIVASEEEITVQLTGIAALQEKIKKNEEEILTASSNRILLLQIENKEYQNQIDLIKKRSEQTIKAPNLATGIIPAPVYDTIKPLNLPPINAKTFKDSLIAVGENMKEWLTENQSYVMGGFDLMFSFVDVMAASAEKAMNKELKTAGNNEKKKDEIRKKYARKQQKLAVAQALINTALAVTNAALTVPFIPAGLIAMIVAAAAGAAQIASIKAQSFALGGIVSGPTLGLVGEYPGARSNPEVIAPLDKLQSMLGNMGGKVIFEIEYDKLVGVLNNGAQIKSAV